MVRTGASHLSQMKLKVGTLLDNTVEGPGFLGGALLFQPGEVDIHIPPANDGVVQRIDENVLRNPPQPRQKGGDKNPRAHNHRYQEPCQN